MKSIRIFLIFISIILLQIKCSNDNITKSNSNIEFTLSDHPVSKFIKERRLSFYVYEKNKLYSFSDDSTQLNCKGDICNDFHILSNEMNSLIINLSDTSYFHWEIMTAVEPYPKNYCNLLLYGSDIDGINLGFMCTIGRGLETSQIILELSKSLSGEAQIAFMDVANYYK